MKHTHSHIPQVSLSSQIILVHFVSILCKITTQEYDRFSKDMKQIRTTGLRILQEVRGEC